MQLRLMATKEEKLRKPELMLVKVKAQFTISLLQQVATSHPSLTVEMLQSIKFYGKTLILCTVCSFRRYLMSHIGYFLSSAATTRMVGTALRSLNRLLISRPVEQCLSG